MSITHLKNLLQADGDGGLKKIVQAAQAVQDLTALLRQALDAGAADHLLAANLHDDGELVLICSSSAWASRLRFDSDALLKTAKAHGIAATHCRVRVATQAAK
jgi:hypothetical protein